MQTTTDILRQRINDNSKPNCVYNNDATTTLNSFIRSNVGNFLVDAKQGGTGRANRLVNIQAQMERIENTIIDVIDYRILRKSGGLRR
jgi:hypothetical protein